jgi:hypothetical protein
MSSTEEISVDSTLCRGRLESIIDQIGQIEIKNTVLTHKLFRGALEDMCAKWDFPLTFLIFALSATISYTMGTFFRGAIM